MGGHCLAQPNRAFPGYVSKDAKLAAVFNIDETSLSNWDAMAGFVTIESSH